MKRQLTLFLLLFFYGAFAQSYCDNLVFEGIYHDAVDEQKLYLVLNHSGSNSISSDSDYANIMIIADGEDTLSSRKKTYQYTLPEKVGEKIVFPLDLHESLSSYKDFADAFTGRIEFLFPDCTLDIAYNNVKIESLPQDNNIECTDYTLLDVIKSRAYDSKYAYLIIHSTLDNAQLLHTGYTSFEYFSEDDVAMSFKTGPNYFLPSLPSDTFAYLVQFKEVFEDFDKGYLKLENPDCILPLPSVINTVQQGSKSGFQLYPNPAHDIIKIESDWPIVKTEMMTSTGKTVQRFLGESPIDISDFSNGHYVLRVLYKNGKVETHSFIIN